MTLRINDTQYKMFCICAECHYGECCVLFKFMPNVFFLSDVLLSDVLLSVVMLSVIMLSVVAPFFDTLTVVP